MLNPTVTPISRVNILGVGVSALTMGIALERSERLISAGEKGYICVTGVHGIMEATRNSHIRAIINESYLTIPDGIPTVWLGKLQHFEIEQVTGPEFMLALCERSIRSGVTHFLYGGNTGVAETLKSSLESRFPGIKIVGTFTPPFRSLNQEEIGELSERIRRCKVDVMWIGLSTPKQELFMREYLPLLDVRLMVGVGAAFDIHTGRIKDAPPWVKKSGLQWAHRLRQDFRRLWKRYLINNPIFVYRASQQLLGLRHYKLDVE